MYAHDINAYYEPKYNEIVFPAAIIQEPFFSTKSKDDNEDDTQISNEGFNNLHLQARNFGGLGAVIAHEITHGYDDEGRHYDEFGMMRDWWKTQDEKEFNTRGEQMIEQFSTYKVHDLPINGKLTLGENLADLGGVVLAFRAFEQYIKECGLGDQIKEQTNEIIQGQINELTEEQTNKLYREFFESWARIWRCKTTKEFELMKLSMDPHSPPHYRIFILRNLDKFFEVYSMDEEHPMWLSEDQRVRLW
jgi:predicted metalloendopeptidase